VSVVGAGWHVAHEETPEATRDHFPWSPGGAEWQPSHPICVALVQGGETDPWQ
jgi:hypothetical protein